MNHAIPNTPLRYAVIGCAAVIASNHLRALASLPGAQIVGMADLNVERGSVPASQAGCPFFTDYRMMLADVRPDVAVICTPHPSHAAIAIDCFAAGAHVLVEKPMAVEVAEADAMIAAADQAQRLLVVNFQQRFKPEIEYARQFIESGQLGALVRVLCIEPWLRTAAYYRSAGWRGSWRGEGGGVLLNQAPHTLDLLCHLAGLPAKVWGWTRTRAHAIECEDTAQAMLEFPNGAPGYFQTSTVEAGIQRQLYIVGDRAALNLSDGGVTVQRFSPPLGEFILTDPNFFNTPAAQTEQIRLPEANADHTAVHHDLARVISQGGQPRCDGRAARMSLELANAITLSSYTGRAVTLPIDRPAYSALLADLRAGEQPVPAGTSGV